MDSEQQRRLKGITAWVVVITLVAAAWLASTAGMAYVITEWRLHGLEHASVKILMQEDKQHRDEHAALRQVILMINQNLAAQQRQAPQAAPTLPPK